jgi:hypothetical protein
VSLSVLNGRREAIRIALAAAEICWVAPFFLVFSRTSDVHHPILTWLGLLVVLLAYSYIYRSLVEAHLPLWFQQGLLVVTLLLSLVLFLGVHAYAGQELRGIGWLVEPFRHLADEMAVVPREWAAMLTLVYLWVRGIQLARRSLSVQSVGFGFRLGVVILLGLALVIRGLLEQDLSGFIVAYFFFGLTAVALARVEEVNVLPNSSQVPFSGFWVGTTIGAAALLTALGMLVAIFFYGGGLRQVLQWLSPLLVVVEVVVAGLGMLILTGIDAILSLFSLNLSSLGQALREAMRRLGQMADMSRLVGPPPADSSVRPPFMGILQAAISIGIPALAVLIIVLITWQRLRRARHREGDETYESLLTAEALANSLRGMVEAGRDRLVELAGLVNRFGVGTRFLSAISIRRIYANLLRLAAEAGYPRKQTQTPYEYLRTLHRVLPGSEADVALITEAYVNARYGEVPETRQELQVIRDCWERVRAREAKRQKNKPK